MSVSGGGSTGPSYADMLKTNVKWDQRLKRNILEITFEKSENEKPASLSQNCLTKLFTALGMNIDRDIEGYSIKQKIISVWVKKGISLERFCKDECIKIAPGVKTGFIRPAGRKFVMVSISGLDFNTPDSFVFEYLSNFGTVTSDINAVIYDKYKDGPFKGKYNGDRKYQVYTRKSKIKMGTYHLIDVSKTRIFYPGNKRTCARCHETSEVCPGKAVAVDCEKNKGIKVSLIDHMKKLWKLIAFKPHDFELESEYIEEEENIEEGDIIEDTVITENAPILKPTKSVMDSYEGISIKNFPKILPNREILAFLKERDISEDDADITIGDHGNVTVEGISMERCIELIDTIHYPSCKKKFFNDRPLYCRAITSILSPEKLDRDDSDVSSEDEEADKPVYDKEEEQLSVKEIIKNAEANHTKTMSKFFPNKGATEEESEDDTEEIEKEEKRKTFLKTPPKKTEVPKRKRNSKEGNSDTKAPAGKKLSEK